MLDLLIRNAHVVRPDRVERADIGIEHETIVEIAPTITGSAREEIDATGLHAFPGVIDPHVHFNEPGRTEWEGFKTGSSALAAGGGTTFFDMPLNSSPPVLDGESFDLKLAAALKNSHADVALWGGLTPNNLDKMEELAERGVVGFKAFMANSGIEDFPTADDYTLYRGMEVAAKLGLIVAVHAENDALTAKLSEESEKHGRNTMRDYLASRPVVAELEAIRRAATFAQATGCKLHIVHVSTWQGSAEVVEAKRWWNLTQDEATDITCETCPHYLLLDTEDACAIGALTKCAPALRDLHCRSRLFMQLTSGGIDFMASDHSPSPPSMKTNSNMFRVWGGIAGVQSTLPALISLGLQAEQVARLTATNAAERFGVAGKGRIAPSSDADLALVDLSAAYTLSRHMLLDRHKLSPYVGRTFRGKVIRTILRGRSIFLDGKMTGPPGGGKLLKPTR